MSAEFQARVQRYAEVIVRVGVNLRAGQPLLIAEPFELQGVCREAVELVEVVTTAARHAGAASVDVIWGDENRWREAGRDGGDRAFERELARHGERMRAHARAGGALLFLQSSHPHLMAGVPARHVARLRAVGWRAYGRVAPDLIAGRANWTTAPAPTQSWASAIFSDVDGTLARLWAAVCESCRVDAMDPIAAWNEHLGQLERQRDELNRRASAIAHFVGEGTDLRVPLAPHHRWCIAALRMADGRRFVANLPTEEIFTAPHRDGAVGIVRIARPITYGGGLIADAELEFQRGRVVRARARHGEELLRHLLATDDGSCRLGEVALVPSPLAALKRDGVCFQNVLLDENAFPHIALGEGYPFTVDASGARALNHSLVHVDLPIAARVELLAAERR